MLPKGKLLIIGGAEDRGGDRTPDMVDRNAEFKHFEILNELIPGKRKKGKIEIVTTPSRHPESAYNNLSRTFHEIGYKDVDFMNIRAKEEARQPEYCERIQKATAVMFSGGDQLRMANIL